MKTCLLAFGLMAASAMPVLAAPQSYTLDGEHTHIQWRVDRFGFAGTMGSFTEIRGEMVLDEDAPQNSSVTAEIALSGLRSDLLEREDIIRGPFWLNAEANPVIAFHSIHVALVNRGDGVQRADVTGVITLNGVQGPLTLHVRLNKLGTDPVTRGPAAGFSAHGSFLRSDFGVMTALGPVGDEVTFQIEALAVAD